MFKLKKIKPQKLVFIISAVFMVACLAMLAGVAYAWFTITDKPELSGSQIGVTKEDNNGYEFIKFNDDTIPDDGLLIYPGDKFILQARALRDNQIFGIRLDIDMFNDQEFEDWFSQREDMTSGLYQTVESLKTAGDNVDVFGSFDIDRYLTGMGFDKEVNEQAYIRAKTEFFKEFVDTNSICSALTIKVLKIGNTTLAQPIVLEATDDDFTSRFYYLEGYTNILKDTIIEIEVLYGFNNFYPTVIYDFGDGAGEATYRSLNYNCFTGQNVNFSFLNIPA